MKESGSKVFSEVTLVVPNASGKGVQLGQFADGEDADWGWRDITSVIEVRGVAATDPSWSRIGSTNFYAYKFGLTDIVWMTFHVPHDIVPGSGIHFHMHWFPDGTDTNTVKWQFEYAFAKGFDQAAFDFAHAESPEVNSGTVTAEAAGPGVQYQHMVTETDAVSVPGLTEPDGLIHVAISRVTNGGTNNTDGIFGLTADIHYQSTNMATRGKAPNFYT